MDLLEMKDPMWNGSIDFLSVWMYMSVGEKFSQWWKISNTDVLFNLIWNKWKKERDKRMLD